MKHSKSGPAFRLPAKILGKFASPDSLLTSNLTLRADIEFTTDCNLRCVYCASLNRFYTRQDLNLEWLDSIVETLKRRGVLTVGVSGHGETTIVKQWNLHCDKMLDSGLQLYISSNLTRELSEAEAQTLSRFIIVQTSCDTDDLRLFKELRRGGDFRNLIYNMGKIRACAVKEGRRPPDFWWHCVVSDKTVWKLEQHVNYGLAQGVKLFNFINLVKHTEIEDAKSVGHITELPPEQLQEIASLFSKVFQTIKKNGATYICDNLFESISERLNHDPSYGFDHRSGPAHTTRQELGMTRGCLDPWIYVKVAVDGGILPCCRTSEALGRLDDNTMLSDIVNNLNMQMFREKLLTGRLEEVCQTCNIRGWTSIEALRLKVVLLSRFGKALPLLHKSGILLPLLYRLRRSALL
jgi:MoaA/NifB/PqqE/SkfB family radical SAM enzyme